MFFKNLKNKFYNNNKKKKLKKKYNKIHSTKFNLFNF